MPATVWVISATERYCLTIHCDDFLVPQLAENLGDRYRHYRKSFNVNGKEIPIEKISGHFPKSDENIVLLLTPSGFIFAAGPIVGILLSLALGAASSILLGLLAPKPELPNDDFENPEISPFNEFQSQANKARPLGRVPAIYGKVRVWPDLILPILSVFNGSTQTLTALYAIGEGSYDLSQIKIGESKIERLNRARFKQVNPGGDPGNFKISRPVEDIQRIKLEGPDNGGGWSQWFTVPGEENNDIWFDVLFSSGLFKTNKQSGRTFETAMELEFSVRPANDRTKSKTRKWSIRSKLTEELRYTISSTKGGSQGLNLNLPTPGEFEVRFRRLTKDKRDGDDNFIFTDDVYIFGIRGIENLRNTTYSDVTTGVLTVGNSAAVTELSGQRLNMFANRKLQKVNRQQGPTGPKIATKRIADAIAHSLTYRKRNQDIDWRGLIEIQDALETLGKENGEFNGVFDKATSAEEEVSVIADLARMVINRQGRSVTFHRDQAAPLSALFNNFNLAPEQETRVFSFNRSDDYDGVAISYISPLLDWKPHEYKYPNDDVLNPLRINLVGAIHWEQAYRRAVYEWERITNRRDSLNVRVTSEGLLLNIFDRIRVADQMLPSDHGRVLGISGSKIECDRTVDADRGDIITIRDAPRKTVETLTVTGQISNNIVQVKETIPEFRFPRGGEQMAAIYTLAGEGRGQPLDDWLIVSIEPEEDYIRLGCEIYTDAPYTADTVKVPTNPLI